MRTKYSWECCIVGQDLSVSYKEQFGKRQMIAGKGCRPTCLNFVHLSKVNGDSGSENLFKWNTITNCQEEIGGLLIILTHLSVA